MRDTFIEWLCADLIRTQAWNWLRTPSSANFVTALKTTRARDDNAPETIAMAAQRLFHGLLQSKSSRAVLRVAADSPEIPAPTMWTDFGIK